MAEVVIKNLPIDLIELNEGQLYGLPANPRWIRDERFRALKKSIEDEPEMLAYRELLVYPLSDVQGHEDKYIIIGGNMRYRACKELGYTELPCKIFPLETPVKKLRAYTIKDNSGFGQWDYDELSASWDENELTDWGMELDYIAPADDEGVYGDDGEAEDDGYDIDQEVEERAHRGEIWLLGEHRLMCGDSTDPADVALLMGGETADLWLTDPPYNVNYGAGGKQYKEIAEEEGGNYQAGKDDRTIQNDNMDDASFREFLHKAYGTAVDAMKPGAPFYIFHADIEGYNFRGAAREVGLEVRQCLIWKKDSLVLGRQDYQWIHEPCLYGWKSGAGHKWYSDRSQVTVLEFDRPKKSELHPTMKPIPLFAYLVANSSKKGDVVLDTFGGSGTTIMACEQLGRRGYSMELDEHYASVIIDRWEKYTGRTAVRVEG